MTSNGATAAHRFKRDFACPICGGHADLPQGQGVRCFGFLSSDGDYAHCTREEHAGPLQQDGAGTYAHRLRGDCRCGRRHGEAFAGSEPIAVYRYGDFEKARFQTGDNKFFAWRAVGVEGWPKGASGARMAEMPLYAHDAVIQRPGEPVIWCEGEKAADALLRRRILAVSPAGGAGQRDFGDALEVLRGRKVYIWPDNDRPGQDHARNVAARLKGIAAEVLMLSWPDAPPKADAFDYFAEGKTAEDLAQLLAAATKPTAASDPLLPQPIDWAEFWRKDYRAEDWLLEPVIPRGRIVSIVSAAKAGKSLALLDMCARLATGQRCLDQAAGEPVDVVYCDLEMTEADLHERLDDMGYGPETDLSHLHYYVLPNLPALDTAEGGEMLLQIARLHDAALVVIDTTSRVLSGPENDADTIRSFYMFTGQPLKADGRALVRLDHLGKNHERGARGSSAKSDDIDVNWELGVTDAGIQLKATHRRQSWIPETVQLVRLEGPLRHERAAEAWPAGTAELARRLDELQVPLEHGRNKVREALRGAAATATNEVLTAAIRYRKQAAQPVRTGARTGASEASTDTLADSPQFRFTDSPADRFGQVAAASADSSVSIETDSPQSGPRSGPQESCWRCGTPLQEPAYDGEMRPVCEAHR